MTSRFSAIAAILLAILLSGCAQVTGRGDGPSGAGPKGIGGSGVFLTGLVVDEELVPIPAATILVTPGDVAGETDEGGAFRVGPLEPAEYVVRAEKTGYLGAEAVVQVTDEDPSPLTLMISAKALNVPYHTTASHVTFVICASYNIIGGVPCTKLVDYAAGTNFSSSEKFAFTFRIPNAGLVDMLVEMIWTPQSFGKDMLFMVQTPPNQPLTAATVKYMTMRGGAPLRGWVVAGIKNQCGSGTCAGLFDAEANKILYEALTVWSNGNATIPMTSLYLNHRTETWMTQFYNRAGTRDFTAVPDK